MNRWVPPATIRGECRLGEDRVRLALYIDSKQVATAEDTRGASEISAFVAYGFSARDTAEDGSRVRRLSRRGSELGARSSRTARRRCRSAKITGSDGASSSVG